MGDPRSLPVFRVSTAGSAAARAERAARVLFGVHGAAQAVEGDRWRAGGGEVFAEAFDASGALWAEHGTRLWQPTRQRRAVVSDAALRRTAHRVVRAVAEIESTPVHFPGVSVRLVEPVALGHTRCREWRSGAGFGAPRIIEKHVRLDQVVVVRPSGSTATVYRLVGGGGKLRVSFGSRGALCGLSSTIRPVVGLAGTARLISRAKAEQLVLASMLGSRSSKRPTVRSELKYFSAPPCQAQTLLAPVWEVSVRFGSSSRSPHARLALVDAREGQWGVRTATVRATARALPARRRSRAPRVMGTWIDFGNDPTLNARDVAQMMGALARAGWVVRPLGNADARRRLWVDGSDKAVECADLSIHVGHATESGWQVRDDEGVQLADVGYADGGVTASGRRWGLPRLKWIGVFGCGPLQDDLFFPKSQVGSAIQRWGGIAQPGRGPFQGLRSLLGFASATAQTEAEGLLFARYLLDGRPVFRSWFRACIETQASRNSRTAPMGPEIWTAALIGGHRTRLWVDDRVVGIGRTRSKAMTPATRFLLIGTQT